MEACRYAKRKKFGVRKGVRCESWRISSLDVGYWRTSAKTRLTDTRIVVFCWRRVGDGGTESTYRQDETIRA